MFTKLKILIGTIFLMTSLNLAAEVKTFCTVTNIRVAQQCVDRLALLLPSYEEPNEAVVAKNDGKLEKLFKALDMPKSVLAKVRAADFVGAVLMHGDEHEIVYYSMKKGIRGIPQVIASVNLVDLESMLIDNNVTANDFFLGSDARTFDVYDDIEAAIAAANEN